MLVELRRLNLVPDAIITALVGRAGYGNEQRRFYSLGQTTEVPDALSQRRITGIYTCSGSNS